PREVVDPVAVTESAYFDEAQLERARDYRSGQRWLFAGGLAAQGAVLLVLAVGRPRRARELLERAGERPVLGAAAAAGGLLVVVSAAALPFDVAAHERAVDVGISTQDLGEWAGDWVKSTVVSAAIAAAVGTGALALVRRYPRRWWIPGSVAAVAVSAVFTWLSPVVLSPLFNDFTELEPGEARADTLELADRAGVDVGEVYRVDASRRSTALNAYVGGLGPTKRVVLYDNLLEDLDRGARRSVIAHELGHVSQDDIPRGIAFVGISAPLALLFAAGLARALARRTGAEPGTPAYLPALAISVAIASFGVGIAGNQLSRNVEARADTVALELTDDPRALIELQTRLAETNLSDPDPPDVASFLLGTHPTALERIGAARAWEQGERP
ncbi:MAG: M48 family metalloprotease, partial [Solirubrobacterales bacterium]